MFEMDVACILDEKYIPKVGKYIVRLGFVSEKAQDVWMTCRQRDQITSLFAGTKKGYSTNRLRVIGVWRSKGCYAYARIERTTFIAPEQLPLDDLRDDA